MAENIYKNIYKKVKCLQHIIEIVPDSGAFLSTLTNLKAQLDIDSFDFLLDNKDEFVKKIDTGNYYGRLNDLFLNLQRFAVKNNKFTKPKVMKKEYLKLDEKNIFNFLCKKFINTKTVKQKDETFDFICCEKQMTFVPIESKAFCEDCGQELPISGYYNEELRANKSRARDYSTTDFCEKWLNTLQGKGILNMRDKGVYDSLLAYMKKRCTRNDKVLVNMIERIKCKDIRAWLKRNRKTRYNKFVPILHRQITKDLGHEITPPQYKYSEEQQILEDWDTIGNIYCEIYNKLKGKKGRKSNNSSYTICILFIVNSRWPNDPRSKRLKDYVHIQSQETMKTRIQAWKETCKQTGYTYVPIY